MQAKFLLLKWRSMRDQDLSLNNVWSKIRFNGGKSNLRICIYECTERSLTSGRDIFVWLWWKNGFVGVLLSINLLCNGCPQHNYFGLAFSALYSDIFFIWLTTNVWISSYQTYYYIIIYYYRIYNTILYVRLCKQVTQLTVHCSNRHTNLFPDPVWSLQCCG